MQWQIPGSDNQPIYGNSHAPQHGKPVKGTIIIAHGLMGYKDYGFIPVLAKQLAKRLNFIVHRFNFSHSGITNSYQRFEHPEFFAKDNWARQIEDLIAVDTATRQQKLPHADPDAPVYWLGHSRGGVTALLAAASAKCPPKGVICASAPSHAINLSPEMIEEIKSLGYMELMSGRTGQVLKVDRQWLDAIEQHPYNFAPTAAIAKVTSDILIVHGQDDPTVPATCAQDLVNAASGIPQLCLIPNCNHVYNSPNPLPDTDPIPEQLESLITAVTGFIAV